MSNILKLSISFLFVILFGYITVSLVNDTYSIENTDFEDINFYRCVVDAYNEENGTSIDYLSDKLTDEQLGSIKSVSCMADEFEKHDILSVDGLEKLVSLETLRLQGLFKLDSIDLSNNSKLNELFISHSKITDLNLEGCPLLKKLYLQYNSINELDLSNNLLLEDIIVLGPYILTEIDLSKHENLKTVDLATEYYIYSGEDPNSIIKLPEYIGGEKPKVELSCLDGECSTIINEDGTIGPIKDDDIVISYKAGLYEISVYMITGFLSNLFYYDYMTVDVYIHNDIIYTKKLDEQFLFNTLELLGFNHIGKWSNTEKSNWLEVDMNNMKVYVKYQNRILKEFTFKLEEFVVPDKFVVSSNNYLYNVDINTQVDDFVKQLDTYGKVTVEKFKILSSDDLVGTGSKVKVKLYTAEYTYEVVVSGDVDGDGSIQLSDIMKVANYLYKDKNSLYNSYLAAADYDKNGKYELSDIMKMANRLYGKKT